ncbi:MAG: RNA methyltransferase [Halobacteriovoraceae bacterium]|nr:RNA methyltransferase [Halobacteriovoraceae bacterium]
MKCYLGLVHHPVTNKKGEQVTTSVTNLDIHDIARSCRTFGIKKYFIITPLVLQHDLVDRILNHWRSDSGSSYNPDRHEALKTVHLVKSIADAKENIQKTEQKTPLVAATGASFSQNNGGMEKLLQRMRVDKVPCLLLLGTGWGLHPSIVERADFCLRPIGYAKGDYNHLSVRSAAAIYLDRFRSAWEE